MKNLLFLVLALVAAPLFAVSPNPYTLPVHFTIKEWGSSGATMTVYAEPGDSVNVAASSGGAESALKTAGLRPGKTYTVNVQGDGLTQYALSFTAPDGYATYVNNEPTDMVTIATSTSWFYHNYSLELRPVASGGRLDAGAFTGIKLGKAISWEVGLGGLRDGRSAGRIVFRELDLYTNDPVSRARLYYSAPNNLWQTTVVTDGASGQTLRQIMTAQALVDLVDDGGGGYWIKFYATSQGTWGGSSYSISGSPWRTIRVESPGAHQLKITETEGSASRVSLLSLLNATSIVATGGTMTTSGPYTIHTFTADGTFALSSTTTVDLIAVAGGGGGGREHAGGGGAGGLVAVNSLSVAGGSHSITVGAGGTGCTWWPYSGQSGSNTTALGYTAIGGGSGNGGDYYGAAGGNGGSGGGSGYSNPALGGSGTSGQGYPGNTSDTGSSLNGGGGGGAGGAGSGIDGGAAVSTWAGTFAGGGGGGYAGGSSGGGGAGAGGWGSSAGGNASANSGSGGGGGGNYGANGGNGGSGIVAIRYTATTMTANEYDWLLQEGDGTTWVRTTRHTNSVPASGQHDDTVEVRTGGTTGTIVEKTKYHYVTQPWGEEVTQVIADPDGVALTTYYDYYTSASAYGNYGRVRTVKTPTDNWTGYAYYDDWDRRGRLQNEFHPFMDSPSTPNYTDTTVGRVLSFDYVADWTGRKTLASTREERINNVRTAYRTSSYVLTLTAIGMPLLLEDRSSYSGVSSSEWVQTSTFRPGAYSHPDLIGLLVGIESSAETRTSSMRYVGNYDPATHAWSFSSYTDMLEVIVHGSRNGTGASLLASWLGMDFPHTWVVPNKSTMDIIIRSAGGLVLRTETHVCTGGTSFALMTWEDYTYDAAGRLTSRVASNGATTSYTYTNGQLTSTTDPTGIETQFTYDQLGRVATSVKKGASAGTYAGQVDITSTNTYDGADHVRQTVVSGGALSQTTTATYDLAGRLTQTVAPGGYTTANSYSSGGRIVSTTLPGNATRITENWPDGRLRQITGTAQVSAYYSYAAESGTGRLLQQQNVNHSTSRWINTYRDWLGRTVEVVVPGWNGYAVSTTNYYNSAGQLYKVSRPGVADTLYVYDTMGALVREGLDINANGSLDLSSSDRITDNDVSYYLGGSIWFLSETRKVYPDSSSSTSKQISGQYTQLTGFPSGRLAGQDSYDVYGNCTSTITEVDRSGKKVYKSIYAPNSSTPALAVTYNGLLVSARDITNRTMTYGYDALGRQTTSVDPRTGTSTTVYVSGTNQVYYVQDGASITQALYSYDSAGRVASVKDSFNIYTYTSYTNRNEVYRQWGGNTYPVEYGYDDFGQRTTMKTYRGGSGWTGSTWPGSPGTADTTTWAYQLATGLLTSKTDASSHSVSYTYTQAGQISTREWARILSGSTHVTTSYSYSSTTGELTGVDYNDSTYDLAYTYNRLGNMATVSDGAGTRTFNYNLSGTLELLNEQLSADYGSRRISYTYATSGVIGRPTGFGLGTSASGYTSEQNITYGYESHTTSTGRFNSFTGGGVTFDYTYATDSNLLAGIANTASGWTQTRTYLSNRDLLDVIETKISSTSKAKFDYAHDNLGRRTLAAKTGEMFNRYGNGTQGLTSAFAYNDRSELTTEITYLGGTTDNIGGRWNDFAYDNTGNRSSTTHEYYYSGTYTTNALNQYTQRTVPGLFDLAGAAASGATVTVNGSSSGVTRYGEYFFKGQSMSNNPNPVFSTLTVSDGTTSTNIPAFTAGTPEAFTYDADGNLTSDGRWNYGYDAENRLRWAVTASAAVAAGAPNQQFEFRYDYLGRRWRKFDEHWSGSAWVVDKEHKFIYQGWHEIEELDVNQSTSAITVVRSHYWGLDLSGSIGGAGGVGGLLMTQEGGNTYLPIYDGNGNVDGMIKASDGTIAAAYEYDAFGNTLRESGAYAASNPFRFSTKYTDIETGLVYYGLRYYSPSMGRFINKDPIEEQGGLNLYGFCGNNGVNKWDYLGQHDMMEQIMAQLAELERTLPGNSDDWTDAQRADYSYWTWMQGQVDMADISPNRSPAQDGSMWSMGSFSAAPDPEPTGAGLLDGTKLGAGLAKLFGGIPIIGDIVNGASLGRAIGNVIGDAPTGNVVLHPLVFPEDDAPTPVPAHVPGSTEPTTRFPSASPQQRDTGLNLDYETQRRLYAAGTLATHVNDAAITATETYVGMGIGAGTGLVARAIARTPLGQDLIIHGLDVAIDILGYPSLPLNGDPRFPASPPEAPSHYEAPATPHAPKSAPPSGGGPRLSRRIR